MGEMMKKMRPHYDQAVADARAADTPEKRRGVGLAWGGFNVTEGGTDQCTVILELDADDRILKFDTWQDLGQGGDVGSLMVTLEALKPMGVTPDRIRGVGDPTPAFTYVLNMAEVEVDTDTGKTTVLRAVLLNPRKGVSNRHTRKRA
jgi:CO/xanthine dehydrogenase Mo-binding subunit